MMSEWRCQYAVQDGLQLACHHWTPPRQCKTRILAWHGFSGCGMDFEILAHHPQNPFDWLAPDWLGHGSTVHKTAPAIFTWADHLRFLQLGLQRFQRQDTVILGYSMGARILLDAAIQGFTGCSRVILVSPNAGIESEVDRLLRKTQDQALADAILDKGVNSFCDHWENHPLISSQQRSHNPG